METLKIGNREFDNLQDVHTYIASIDDLKRLKEELKIFDSFVLRMIYEAISEKNDKAKLTKNKWIEAIYKINY
jgi:hypothetical protein